MAGGTPKPGNNALIENEAGQNAVVQLLRGTYSITSMLHLNNSQASPSTMINPRQQGRARAPMGTSTPPIFSYKLLT